MRWPLVVIALIVGLVLWDPTMPMTAPILPTSREDSDRSLRKCLAAPEAVAPGCPNPGSGPEIVTTSPKH